MDNFDNHEPISRFLIQKLKFSPVKTFLLLVIVHVVIEMIPGIVYEATTVNKNYLGVFEDYAGLGLGLVIVPSSWAFFIWLPIIAKKNVLSLCQSDVISKKDREKFFKIVDQVIGITKKKYYYAIVVFISIAITVLAQITSERYDPPFWGHTIPIYNYILLVPKMALSFYIFVQYAIWTLLLIVLLNRIFNSISINLIPYHYDNASGLGMVGDFSYGIGRISLIMGLFIILEIVTALTRGQGISQLNIILEVIAFPILTIAFFFLPLISCRKEMVKAKEDILQSVGDKIQDAMKKINKNDDPSPSDFKEFNDLVNYQEKLREDIHTWPISVQLFRRFSLRFLISAIPGLFSIGLELAKFFENSFV